MPDGRREGRRSSAWCGRPDDVVRVDETGRAPGRGAYVHATVDCVRRAGRAGAIGRALRTRVDGSEVGRLMADVSGRRDGLT